MHQKPDEAMQRSPEQIANLKGREPGYSPLERPNEYANLQSTGKKANRRTSKKKRRE